MDDVSSLREQGKSDGREAYDDGDPEEQRSDILRPDTSLDLDREVTGIATLTLIRRTQRSTAAIWSRSVGRQTYTSWRHARRSSSHALCSGVTLPFSLFSSA